MAIMEVITNFLRDEKFMNPGDAIGDSDSLLERGIIDSLGVLKLVVFLEETYGIKIDEDDLMPENFDSLSAISSYVSSKLP